MGLTLSHIISQDLKKVNCEITDFPKGTPASFPKAHSTESTVLSVISDHPDHCPGVTRARVLSHRGGQRGSGGKEKL